MATLYHWDLPQALQDEGGRAARDTTERFAEYASQTATALGGVVAGWITHNEPNVAAFVGHAAGRHAPGVRDWATALRVSHHLLLSHGLAVRALRSALPSGAPVGITLNLHPAYPADDTEADRAAATLADGHQNRWFLDPVFRGRYPQDMLDQYARARPAGLRPRRRPRDDRAADRLPRRQLLLPTARRRGRLRRAARLPPRRPAAAADGDGVGAGRGRVRRPARRLGRDYGDVPFWITENGAAIEDTVADGRVNDPRADRLPARPPRRGGGGARGGVDIRRYFVWSFLDNFEWAEGYRPRFGIVRVDYDTQRRTPKASAAWYRDRIAEARPDAPP